jgi:phosphohistidine phosphatase
MNVFLLRHGDALSANENPARPLSPRGRQEIERTARIAVGRNVAISVIYHSGILRAAESAEIMRRLLLPPSGIEEHTGLLPEDDPAIVKVEIEGEERSILLVGHLPYLNRLAALLVNGDADRAVVEFLPAMMACFAKVNDRWKVIWTSIEPENLMHS